MINILGKFLFTIGIYIISFVLIFLFPILAIVLIKIFFQLSQHFFNANQIVYGLFFGGIQIFVTGIYFALIGKFILWFTEDKLMDSNNFTE